MAMSYQSRQRTDESLRAERGKTDHELGRRRSSVEESADDVVRRARDSADEVLQVARVSADEKTDSANAAVLEERAQADSVIAEERLAADARIQGERAERKRALANLLRLEREETDQHLLTERGFSDQALSTRDLFLAMVSHDLRTMLGGIAMTAEILARDAGFSGEHKAEILSRTETIQRFTARMNRLIGDLVDVASIEAGRILVAPEEDDLLALLRESAAAFGPSAEARGIALVVDVGNTPLRAMFDRERILQVLANLLGNALKFCQRGARISMRAQAFGERVRVSVADTGPGIAAATLEAIFEKFWQVGRRDRRGLGLGLYISRQILEAHGGRIWAQSDGAGGSTFHFELPAA